MSAAAVVGHFHKLAEEKEVCLQVVRSVRQTSAADAAAAFTLSVLEATVQWQSAALLLP